ncbi:unnamed protein product [Orchesella dallaii]|uniref:C2H2-type domain-containing protein n=1 Tax=Orchesella dallaii TaxID=48710 RepID=A0ABP1R6P9_9HEXA
MSTNAIKERYACAKCDKSFTVPFSLRRHMIVHGVRPHGCQICHKRFARMSDLKKHLKTHEKKVYPVKVTENQAAQPHHSLNNGNTNVIAQETAGKTPQTQAALNSNGTPVVRDDQFRKQNNVTQCGSLSNTTGRIVSKSSSIGNEEDSNMVGGRKQQPEALGNEPVGTTRKILILFSVGPNPNNCIPGQCPSVEPDSSDQLQIAFQEIMDELAKSGSSTVDRSNP